MRTLGLDLGPNSIGWALLELDDESKQGRIVATGVRIFPEGVDNFDTKKEKPKNQDRRLARGMRRQIQRRARRRHGLVRALVRAGLLPENTQDREALLQADPYALRAKALDERVELFEFGRILLHLGQRRGFLSNRKTDRADKSEKSKLLKSISGLESEMRDAGSRTLGEHLFKLRANPHDRIRGRHTRRSMYLDEFEKLWDSQQRFHSEVLTDKLKYGEEPPREYPIKPRPENGKRDWLSRYGLHGILFFQRKMYWPKSSIGFCQYEPKERRCERADRAAQRFRMLQEVNNLRIIEPGMVTEAIPLTCPQRTLLLEKLSQKEKMEFGEIRKALGFLDTVQFNLERGKRKSIQGMVTDAKLAGKKIFGPSWYERPDKERDAIVRCLITDDDNTIRHLAMAEWGLNGKQAEELLSVDLPEGLLNLSRNAIVRLLPHLDRRLLMMTDDGTPSALSEAGYLRPDQRKKSVAEFLPSPPELTNPVVRQALFEFRKVVNAIIREHGMPAEVRVELGRNVKVSGRQRQEINDAMRKREEERQTAKEAIETYVSRMSRDAIDRYLLWKEQGEKCVYSGQPIGIAQLFGGEIDIDHILPRSRCLDDSFTNKVVCFRAFNDRKGNRTPYEWLAETDTQHFERVLQHVKDLPYAKRRRFSQKTLELDDFLSRQLNDTRYISREVLKYVRLLLAEDHKVLCLKGQQTAELRHHWGLNSVLRHDQLDLKNRDDHRHHAVDAIVVALTDHRRLQHLADIFCRGRTDTHGEILPDPWEGFRHDVEAAVNQINVSHRVHRKISGALHEDTIYGPTPKKGVFVVRKPVESLSPSEVEKIRDPAIRQIVEDRLADHGIKVGRGIKDKSTRKEWEVALKDLTMPSGVSIRKVRVLKNEETIRPIRCDDALAWVRPGNTHHVTIFELSKEGGKVERILVPVTALEARNRIKNRQPLIEREYKDRPNARFVMSLSQNEMVLLEHDGREDLYTFETAAGTSGQMWFRHHTAAGKSSDKKGVVSKMPNTINARKVTVDPLGRIRWAND